MKERNREQLDFVAGDAYSRSFGGHAIIGQLLVKRVYRRHNTAAGLEDKKGGNISAWASELEFLVSSGNMDSMVNHYSVSKSTGRKVAFAGRRAGRCQDVVPVYAVVVAAIYDPAGL